MLKYSFRENLLTADPDDCMAQVQDVRSYSHGVFFQCVANGVNGRFLVAF